MPLLLVSIILFMPYMGMALLYFFQDKYSWLIGGEYSLTPIMMYSLFLVCFFAPIIMKERSVVGKNFKVDVLARKPNFWFIVFVVVLCFFLVMIPFQGLLVLAGELSKEQVRQMGPVYAFLTKYLLPSLLAYICLWHRFSPNRQTRVALYTSFVLTLLIGLASGGKASAIFVLLPGLIALYWGRLNFSTMMLLFIFSFGSIVLAGVMFDSFIEDGLFGVVLYVLHRAFMLTAELPYIIPIRLLNEDLNFDYATTLFEFFGKSNIKVLVDVNEAGELYKYGFSTAISAAQYPDQITAVNAGEWNMTPNIFIEALLTFGTYGFPVFGLLAGYFVAFIIRSSRFFVSCGRFDLAALSITYFVFVVLSWVNSAGIAQLAHPLMLFSMMATFLLLRLASLRLKKAVFCKSLSS